MTVHGFRVAELLGLQRYGTTINGATYRYTIQRYNATYIAETIHRQENGLGRMVYNIQGFYDPEQSDVRSDT